MRVDMYFQKYFSNTYGNLNYVRVIFYKSGKPLKDDLFYFAMLQQEKKFFLKGLLIIPRILFE